jgi:hypothetical protein
MKRNVPVKWHCGGMAERSMAVVFTSTAPKGLEKLTGRFVEFAISQ